MVYTGGLLFILQDPALKHLLPDTDLGGFPRANSKLSFVQSLIENSKKPGLRGTSEIMHLASPHGTRDVKAEAQREKGTKEIIKDHNFARKGVLHVI